ncbi:hypothetical protein MYMA111404_00500 [Mycoplasma marinum]|uniref:hypothetical protein n=1 Tax=Mycoplasma marinum TaxID=1937190 RepID=UPI0014440D09|nr:hypothetical protein [Mycoplasma marinum]
MSKNKQKNKLTIEEKKARQKTLLKVFAFCMILLIVLAVPMLILELEGIVTRP